MKNLLIIAFILIGFAAYAQPTINQPFGTPSSTVIQKGWIKNDSGFVFPMLDTSRVPVYVGETRFKISDTTLYIAIRLTGRKWMAVNQGILASSVAGVSSVNTAIGGTALTITGGGTGALTLTHTWGGSSSQYVTGAGGLANFNTGVQTVADALYSPLGHGHFSSDIVDLTPVVRNMFTGDSNINVNNTTGKITFTGTTGSGATVNTRYSVTKGTLDSIQLVHDTTINIPANRLVYTINPTTGRRGYDIVVPDTASTVQILKAGAVDNVAALVASNLYLKGITKVWTRGYYAVGDGGATCYNWIASSHKTVDNAFVYAPTGYDTTTNGRYELVIENNGVHLTQLGGQGNFSQSLGNPAVAFDNAPIIKAFLTQASTNKSLRTLFVDATASSDLNFLVKDSIVITTTGLSIIGVPHAQTPVSRLMFNGTSGLIIRAANTVIENLAISDRTQTIKPRGNNYGIFFKERSILRGNVVSYFNKDGIRGFANPADGNIDQSEVSNNFTDFNVENGLWLGVGDGNVIYVSNHSASNNGGYGILDSSFLGCIFLNCHTNANGGITFGATLPRSYVTTTTGGARRFWIAMRNSIGQSPLGGSSATYWVELDSAYWYVHYPSNFTAWNTDSLYYESGAVASLNENNTSTWINTYLEDGQPFAAFMGGAKNINGHQNLLVIGNQESVAQSGMNRSLRGFVTDETSDGFFIQGANPIQIKNNLFQFPTGMDATGISEAIIKSKSGYPITGAALTFDPRAHGGYWYTWDAGNDGNFWLICQGFNRLRILGDGTFEPLGAVKFSGLGARLALDTTNYKLQVQDASGNVKAMNWPTGGGSTTAAATFNNSGSGAASGTTFDGSTARTISYNTIGAQPTLVSGTNIKTVNGTSLLGSSDVVTVKNLSSQYTDASNVSTGETDLLSYTLPANTLLNNGDRIVIEAMFTTPSNADTKDLKFYFGSSTQDWTASTIASGATIKVKVTIVKTGASTQRQMREFTTDFTEIPGYTTSSSTDTGTILIKFTGTCAASNDITQRTMSVTYYPN